jgi:hypothetical protein
VQWKLHYAPNQIYYLCYKGLLVTICLLQCYTLSCQLTIRLCGAWWQRGPKNITTGNDTKQVAFQWSRIELKWYFNIRMWHSPQLLWYLYHQTLKSAICTHASYPGCPGLVLCLETGCNEWCFVPLYHIFRKVLGCYYKLSHSHLLLHDFQFTITHPIVWYYIHFNSVVMSLMGPHKLGNYKQVLL